MSLTQTVAAYVDAQGLLRPGEGVVVGVSGGADSVALLAVLRQLARRKGRAYRLTVAHLHHGLRASADVDERFVRKLARSWRLPCMAERCDVRSAAADASEGIEEAGRRLRYDFLRRVAEERGASSVAVGHHCDDNVETVLLNLCRGTHMQGLAGMPPSRPIGDSAVRLVRPLLGCRRAEIEAFCRRERLTWREDPTNQDTSLRRNFVRHDLLPLLRGRLNPKVDQSILRLAEAAGKVEQYLASQAESLLAGCAAAVRGAPPLVGQYALRLLLEQGGAAMNDVTADRLRNLWRALASAERGQEDLPGGVRLAWRPDAIEVQPAAPGHGVGEGFAPVPVKRSGRTQLPGGVELTCRIAPFAARAFEQFLSTRQAGQEWLDADRLVGRLTVRPRRVGDAFRPLGSPGRKGVGDFLTDRKFPRSRRVEVLCLCDEKGIVYLSPLRIDHRVRVRPATRRVLRVRVEPAGL